mgnify:CR=1 FL=1
MKRLILLLTACLVGCAAGDPMANLPLYTSLAATAVKTELTAGVTRLSDADLQSRRKIMNAVVPITMLLDDLAAGYKADLDAEAARRGLAAIRREDAADGLVAAHGGRP